MLKRLSALKRQVVRGRTAQPDRLEIFPDDAFLVSYPRSGNTWLRKLVATALHPEHSWGVQNLSQAVPDIHVTGQNLADWPRPRIIKSHASYQPDYPRVVYLYRDGRDVAVSYFNYYQTVNGFRGDLDNFLQSFLAGKFRYGRWDHHINAWLAGSNRIALHPLSYEALYLNTTQELTGVLTFLGRQVAPGTIAAAVAACTFEHHQADVREHSPTHRTGYQGGVQGSPGGWRRSFSPDQLEMFWSVMGQTMHQLGYSLE